MTATRSVAVVGARGVGVGHVAALRQLAGVQVSLIVGSTSETAQTAARSLGVPHWSADWQAAVDDEAISAVHVCTPNDLHLPIAAAALAAGKHVICEKPLARSASEASQLAGLARDHGHLLSVLGYKYRYAPLIQVLREHVQQGRLGRIHEIRASYLQNWMLDPERSTWRRDADRGGRDRVLLDIGTHLLDLMETTLGARLVSLHGQLFRAEPSASEAAASADADPAAATDDGAHLLLRFENGTSGVAALSQVSAAHTHQIGLTLDGAMGSAQWRLGEVETLEICDAGDTTRLRLDGHTSHATSGRHWRRATDPDHLLVPLLAEAYGQLNGSALQSHRTGCGVPLPTFDDGRRHIELIQAL